MGLKITHLLASGLACAAAVSALTVELSGIVHTIKYNYPLRGVTVVLANAKLQSTDTTNYGGAWAIQGEVGLLTPRAGASKPVRGARKLLVENGRLLLSLDGRNVRGGAISGSVAIPPSAGMATLATPRATADSVVVDTLLYWYKGSLIARAPITIYTATGLNQLVDTAGIVSTPVAPGPAGVAQTHPLSIEKAARMASGMKFIQSRNRKFLMGVRDSLNPIDTLAIARHEVSFSYNFWIDSTEKLAVDFAQTMTWALDSGLVVLVTDQDGKRRVTSPSGRLLFQVVPVTGNGSTLQMDYNATTKTFSSAAGGGKPIEEATIHAAFLFANFASMQAGLEPVYDTTTWNADFTKNGYRLPTEAEWEFAARGGVATEFPWGNTWNDTEASRVANTGADLWPVAFLRPNPYGLYDMLGNTLEFVGDWCAKYTTASVVDPIGPATGTTHVARGSAAGEVDGRIGFRQEAHDVSKLGFRLVLPVR